MKSTTSALLDLAALCGVQASYVAVDGSTRGADQDVVLALLRALDVPVASQKDAPEALRARQLADARRILEPVVVVRTARPSPIRVILPEGVDPRRVHIGVDLESGIALFEGVAPGLTLFSGIEAGGRRYGLYRFELARLSGGQLAPGYYRLHLEGEGVGASALLVVAPSCPAAQRGWGAFMPVHALRSESDWGVGSYSELAVLGRFVGALGAAFVGSLPLYPSYLDPPADPSPYRPVSRLAYNELFIDPTELPEIASSTAEELLRSDHFTQRVQRAHKSALVEYEDVAVLRREILETMARSVFAGEVPGRREELDAFARSHPELVAYARFRTLRERAGQISFEERTAPDGREDSVFGYHLYCQWAAASQMSTAGEALGLYADLPIGVHPDGFDPYWSPGSFVTGLSGGAPPDAFFESGQDWGFPPLHPERTRQDGYSHFRGVLARAFRHAGYMRIDHVMGLQRLYAIPQGFDAKHGAYLAYHADELHALVSLEAHRAGTVVVGEDLGTVPDEVRERMSADKMLRSWVFQFESTAKEPFPAPPSDVLASLGTHDLPRFGAFLWGKDIEERQATGQLSKDKYSKERAAREAWRTALLGAGEPADSLSAFESTAAALEASLAHLASSSAKLVLVDLEELWDERQPQNRPGTGPEANNWRRRAALSLPEILTNRRVIEMLLRIDELRRTAPAGLRGRK